MKLKNVLSVMAVMVLLAPAAKGITSYAANTGDEPYLYFLTTANTSAAYTGFREKTNDSSIYIMPTAMTGNLSSVGVEVRARKTADGSISAGLTGSKHYYYTYAQLGKGYKVYNLVYENGYSFASVGFYSRSGSGNASGVWSPDCANEELYSEMPYTR